MNFNTLIKVVVFIMCLFIINNNSFAENSFGIGYVATYSKSYEKMLDGACDRASLEGSDEATPPWWNGFYFEKKIDVSPRLSIDPRIVFLFAFVDSDIPGDNVDSPVRWHTDMAIVPTVNINAYFSEKKSWYGCGQINYNIPKTWSDVYDFESGGMGYGIGIGVQNENFVNVELGYLYIPIDVSDYKKENIAGGFYFKFGKTF